MIIEKYTKVYNEYFSKKEVENQMQEAVELLSNTKRVFFVGNGGSNAICSHMFEDFAKVARYQTFSFTDSALITCFANDYGYENAMKEWLSLYIEKGDVLIAISSSGNSMNIVNACDMALSKGAEVISFSAFKSDNRISQKGKLNFHIPVEDFGIAECFHQVIIHAVLDKLVEKRKALGLIK